MTWSDAISALANQVSDWISGDLAKQGHLVLHEQNMVPTPDEPLLEIVVGETRILRLEPTLYDAQQVPTTVNLYTYPTLRRVVLAGPEEDGSWKILSSDGVEMRFNWNEQDFVALVKLLAEPHAARRI